MGKSRVRTCRSVVSDMTRRDVRVGKAEVPAWLASRAAGPTPGFKDRISCLKGPTGATPRDTSRCSSEKQGNRAPL